MWEMAASHKNKISQKNLLISKQILNIEVHTCFISKHVSMCWFLNSSRFSVKLQMIFNLFPPPFLLKKSLPLRSDMLYGWPPTIVENCEQNCEQKCEQNCELWTVNCETKQMCQAIVVLSIWPWQIAMEGHHFNLP